LKKFSLISLLLLFSALLFAGDITFSGDSSRLSLQESGKTVTLTGNAVVTMDALTIRADSISIEGEEYSKLTCNGNVRITDTERGFSIRTSTLHYNRDTERLVIAAYSEISDTANGIEASAGALTYDLGKEALTLSLDVNLIKASEDTFMRANAEKAEYDRKGQTLALLGGAFVYFKENNYNANAILVNLETDEIKMEGAIRGTING
jgi:OstA-like protein.